MASIKIGVNLSYLIAKYPSSLWITISGATCKISWAITPISFFLIKYPSSPPFFLIYSSVQSNVTPFIKLIFSNAFSIILTFSFNLESDEW